LAFASGFLVLPCSARPQAQRKAGCLTVPRLGTLWSTRKLFLAAFALPQVFILQTIS